MKLFLTCVVVTMLLPGILMACMTTDDNKPDVTVFDADISLATNQTYYMSNTNNYILGDGVFVDPGCTLIIDSGTVIKGLPGEDVNSKYLCVARGARIYANGTRNYPIIFTSTSDDVDDPYDIPLGTNGLWGGVLILGAGPINATSAAGIGVNQIEGIPSTNPKGEYGGGETPNPEDTSGVFRYVSIRHGGTEIGAANEINGLTMGGLGSGTVIEYVEVFNNYDDGFEFFGGTVNTKYLVSAFNGDDNFDYDEGFNGCHQFWFVIQDDEFGDRAGEHDGGTDPEDGEPYACPYISNVTYIGTGQNNPSLSNECIIFRDNAGGHYYNSIFYEFPGPAVEIEDLADPNEDSRKRLEDGYLIFEGNFFCNIADNTPTGIFPESWTRDSITDPAHQNVICTDPQIISIGRDDCLGLLYPMLDPASPANTPGVTVPETCNGHIVDVDYRGAFPAHGEGDFWISCWTYVWDRHIAGIPFIPTLVEGKRLHNVAGQTEPDPVGSTWEELYPEPGQEWEMTSWHDNGDGYLSFCDTVDFVITGTVDTVWEHVELVIPTLVIEKVDQPGELIYIDMMADPAMEPLDALNLDHMDVCGTYWHEVAPNYSNIYFFVNYKDTDDNRIVDSCDLIYLDLVDEGDTCVCVYHVVDVAVDLVTAEFPPCQGECGNANNQGGVNVADAVWIINYVFAGGDSPQPVLACGNANGQGGVNVADAVWIINYVFAGGDPPGDCDPGNPLWIDGDCCPFQP